MLGTDAYLVQVYYKDNIVSEHCYSMQDGHFDNKGKKVIDDRRQEFEGHEFPWHMSDTLEFIIEIQLGAQQDKAKAVNELDRRV